MEALAALTSTSSAMGVSGILNSPACPGCFKGSFDILEPLFCYEVGTPPELSVRWMVLGWGDD